MTDMKKLGLLLAGAILFSIVYESLMWNAVYSGCTNRQPAFVCIRKANENSWMF